ncbi:MAG: hypothetical protein KKH61_20185, partial [Gammaproteobacteria bacterium]|nr:hypothetical protein [Gammaproteobacteria bacterium]
VDDQKSFDELSTKYSYNPKIKFYKYEWIDDFANKRNFLASKTKSDYYFRLDTDDTIDHPEFLQQAFTNYAKNKFTLVMFRYMYGFDTSGNCNAMHWRETIIKNDGNIFWNKKIHENVNYVATRKVNTGKETQIGIIHKHDKEDAEKSLHRNFALILREYEEVKAVDGKQDPRTVGYLARMYMAKKEYAKAVPLFEEFISTSGWDEDKYFAWIQLSDCLIYLGAIETALSCVVEALLLNPTYPDAYFHMMAIYYEKKDWKKAIEWGELGFAKPTPETMYVTDPSSYTWRPAAQIAVCYVNAGKFEKAIRMFTAARKLAPLELGLKTSFTHFLDIYNDNESVTNYLRLLDYVREDLKSFRLLVDSIPARIRNDERLSTAITMIEPPKKWEDKSVVFFCGGAWEDWVDTSVIGGIGGSEEATVYLSREFTKLGYKVTVFNQCGELEGMYNGVEYKNYHKFHPKDEYDILICWRSNMLQDVKARKKYVWLHDIPFKDTIIDEDFESLDGVIVLSEYHKSFLSHLKDQSKIIVSRNGLNIKDFENISEIRNPHRMIYASSYDRGLQHLLEHWKEVRKEVPDAELHIFYGWNTYLEMMKIGRRPKEYYDMMCELMKQEGVTEHGRIGQKKLVKEYSKSGIWAYPCHFEEISCIGGMRAMATGAVPCYTDYAALKETVKYGVKVEGDVKDDKTYDLYTRKLIKL